MSTALQILDMGCDITFPPTSKPYTKECSSSIKLFGSKIASSSDVISTLSIFDPVNVPGYEADGFQEYGNASVNILAKHFFQIETEEVQS